MNDECEMCSCGGLLFGHDEDSVSFITLCDYHKLTPKMANLLRRLAAYVPSTEPEYAELVALVQEIASAQG